MRLATLMAHGGLVELIVLLSVLAHFEAAFAQRLPGDYMNEMWTGYTTPHIPWAKPYSRGKIRAFFIAPYTAAREVAELAQRLDLEVFGESTISERSLGATDIYHAQVQGTSPKEKAIALLRKLKQRYDVIVLANFDYALLPIEVQYRIAEQVTEGSGLVLVYRRNPRPEFFRHPDDDGRRFICSGIPFGGLSFYKDVFVTKAKLTSLDQIGEKLVGAYRLKDGRVVQIDFGIQSDATYGGFCLTPRESFTFQSQAQYEYHQMLIINAIVWAAKREPPTSIEMPEICRTPVKRLSLPMSLKLVIKSELQAEARVIVTIRNAWGEEEQQTVTKINLQRGSNEVPITVKRLCGGGHYFDVRVIGANGALGWASFWLDVKPEVSIAALEMDKPSYERTEHATGTVKLSSPPSGKDWSVAIRLLDNYQRIYAKHSIKLRRSDLQIRFGVPLTNAVSIAGRCRAILMAGKEPVDQVERVFFIPRRQLEIFPTLLWGTLPGILGHWLHEQIRKAGFNTVLLPHYFRPWEESENFERRLISAVSMDDMLSVPYTTHITQWRSLGDNATYERRLNEFKKTAQFFAIYAPLVYSLGDENSIPEEAGFEDADRQGFISYLKREYGTIEELNRAWGTNFSSFDEAMPIRLSEAREKRRFAQYHDTETYREELYARWHHWLNKVYKSVDPYAKVGSEGSEPGDLEKTIHGLEFWGPYRDPVYQTLLRSLAPRSLIRGSWFGGYVSARRDLGGLQRFLWDTFLDGSNLFQIYCCYTCETIFNNDLTFGYWANAFLPDLREIVDGIGQLQMASEHDNDPIAIYHSQASVHAAALHSPFGVTRNQEHFSAITLISDAGFQPYYITSNQVKSGILMAKGAPKLLFLAYEQAISDEEVKAIHQFVENGGVVIADVVPAIMDGRCVLRNSGALDKLFGVERAGQLCAPRRALLRVKRQSFPMAKMSLNIAELEGFEVLTDAAVKVTMGKALGMAEDVPAIIVNRVGGGTAILLNFAVAHYRNIEVAKREWLRDLIFGIALSAGVKPFCQILTPDGKAMLDCRVSRFKRGSIVTVGILAPRPSPISKDVPARFVLSKPAHIYDQRSGNYLGFSGSVSLIISPNSAKLLSLLPYRVIGLKISGDSKIFAGSSAKLGISLQVFGGAPPEGHIYRLRFQDPKGEDVWHYARTLRTDGTSIKPAFINLPFAYNDQIGTWTVAVRDVATGVKAIWRLRVLPSQDYAH